MFLMYLDYLFILNKTYFEKKKKKKENNGQKINAVMFQPKSKLQVTRWIIGAGQVNSGGLSVKHAVELAWQRAFRKQ